MRLFLPFLSLCMLLSICSYAKHARRSLRLEKGRPNELTFVVPMIIGLDEGKGAGMGLDYNRYLDKAAHFSVNMGIYLGFHRDRFAYYKHGGDGGDYTEGNVFFVAPGIQYHPFGNRRVANYSIGLACEAGNINKHTHLAAPGPSGIQTIDEQTGLIGIALTNDIIVNNNRHPNGAFGGHLAVGYNLLASGAAPFIQFGLKLGLKF